MKTVSGVVIALFLLSMGLISVPVSAHTETEPRVVDLLAGQTIDVGDVLVWNDGDYLYVKYVTTDGWLLTETHLAIATAFFGIPQTKTGNPIPGKFTYFAYHDPPVDEYTYPPIDLTSNPGTDLYIAAHAVVRHDYTLLLVSDAETLANGLPAVDAYEPNTWYPNLPYTESFPSLWDNVITSSHNFELSGADWIWNSYFVNEDDSTHGYSGEIVEFTRTFGIPGTPTAGTLWITCDNGYEAKLNGQFIGSAQLSGEWRTSNLHEAFVHTSGWQTAESYDVLGALGAGQNTLAITGVNEYLNIDDGDPFLGDEGKNPAGLIYELNINYYQQETAWGDGMGFVGANWATYFTYKVQGWQLVETIQVPAAQTTPTYSSNTLEEGKLYKIVASGTAYAGGNYLTDIEFDAEYSYTWSDPQPTVWVDGVAHYEGYGPNLLDLKVEGQFIDWGPFNSDHTYEHIMTGTGSTLTLELLIYDIYYPNNSGSLTVNIYVWG